MMFLCLGKQSHIFWLALCTIYLFISTFWEYDNLTSMIAMRHPLERFLAGKSF